MKKFIVLCCIVQAAILCQYCSKKDTTVVASPILAVATDAPQLPVIPYNYGNTNFPAHIASALLSVDNTPAANPISDNGVTLGRVLFYDKHLSQNNTVSCASCHKQELSFADDVAKSTGFAGGLTARNSMSLLNVRFYRSGKMFWDERANTLEEQVLMPIQNTTEMGLTLDELVTKVKAQTYYPDLFQKAFGSNDISTDRISKALAQFVRSIVTIQSKYDLVKQGQATFTADERDGEQLFLTAGNIACAKCHTPPMFLTSDPQAPFSLPDNADLGINNERRFKSGSLRNIANTAPYFHNGSVASLQAMLAGPNGTPIPQHTVAPQDRQKLLAFLQTLTDASCLTDAKYASPFK